LRDSVQNPHTGFLVPYGNPDAFAEKILAILSNDKLRLILGQGGVDWARNFDWDKSADEWLSVLKDYAD
jgi:glycosyltransferase involved in cell wall biosynthesis